MYNITHKELEKVVGGDWRISALRNADGQLMAQPIDSFKTRKDVRDFLDANPLIATYNLSNGHHFWYDLTT